MSNCQKLFMKIIHSSRKNYWFCRTLIAEGKIILRSHKVSLRYFAYKLHRLGGGSSWENWFIYETKIEFWWIFPVKNSSRTAPWKYLTGLNTCWSYARKTMSFYWNFSAERFYEIIAIKIFYETSSEEEENGKNWPDGLWKKFVGGLAVFHTPEAQ